MRRIGLFCNEFYDRKTHKILKLMYLTNFLQAVGVDVSERYGIDG